MQRCPWRPEEGNTSPDTEVTGAREPLHLDSGTQALVHGESSACILLLTRL